MNHSFFMKELRRSPDLRMKYLAIARQHGGKVLHDAIGNLLEAAGVKRVRANVEWAKQMEQSRENAPAELSGI